MREGGKMITEDIWLDGWMGRLEIREKKIKMNAKSLMILPSSLRTISVV